jgi:hypothetical protein
MRRICLMCAAAVLLTAPFATAATVWNPTDANSLAAGYSNWTIASNWTLGLPVQTGVSGQNGNDPKAVFNVAGRPECIIDSTVICGHTSLGDNGTTAGVFVRIKDGGSLTTGYGIWTGVGYNRQGTLTVEQGGTLTCNANLLIGRDGNSGTGTVGQYPSYLIIDGGTVTVATTCQLGNNDADKVDGGGIVKLNSGVLNVGSLAMQNQAVSRLDIKYGTLIINGNATANLTNWTTGASTPGNVKIVTGFGGQGTVVFDYNVTNPGKTTVKAIGPMNPFPAYGAMVGEGLVDLAWTNMDPNTTGDPVFVDVWFGTDPTWVVDEIDPNNSGYVDFTKVVVAGENVTGVQVEALVVGTAPTTYYWQVDSYIYGSSTGTPIEGDVFKFDVTNDFPPTVVINTPNMVTWANQPVQLDATISDTGTSPVTITWTSNPAGAVFTPSAAVEDPVVTANPAAFPTTYTLTCSVKDAQSPAVVNTDTVVLQVAADACAAAILAGANYPMDIVEPFCVVNIHDLAALAADWLTDYTLTVPTVIP